MSFATYDEQRSSDLNVIAGFLFHSETDTLRDDSVCQITERCDPDTMFGIEPRFRIQFADGVDRDVLAHQLSPWYSVGE